MSRDVSRNLSRNLSREATSNSRYKRSLHSSCLVSLLFHYELSNKSSNCTQEACISFKNSMYILQQLYRLGKVIKRLVLMKVVMKVSLCSRLLSQLCFACFWMKYALSALNGVSWCSCESLDLWVKFRVKLRVKLNVHLHTQSSSDSISLLFPCFICFTKNVLPFVLLVSFSLVIIYYIPFVVNDEWKDSLKIHWLSTCECLFSWTNDAYASSSPKIQSHLNRLKNRLLNHLKNQGMMSIMFISFSLSCNHSSCSQFEWKKHRKW